MLNTVYVKRVTSPLQIECARRGRIRSCYRLQLANGLSWYLVTTDQSEGWIAEVAAAMRLKRCDPLLSAGQPHAKRGVRLSAPGTMENSSRTLPRAERE